MRAGSKPCSASGSERPRWRRLAAERRSRKAGILERLDCVDRTSPIIFIKSHATASNSHIIIKAVVAKITDVNCAPSRPPF
ncbi:hypothetical protein J6590_024192 [Homalodisca vitripennis]|nr:hypothetical protein J6590_024192 [Homalodisca vitripennis]